MATVHTSAPLLSVISEKRSKFLLKILFEQQSSVILFSACKCNGAYDYGFHEYFSSSQKTTEQAKTCKVYQAARRALIERLLQLPDDEFEQIENADILWESVKHYEQALETMQSEYLHCLLVWKQAIRCGEKIFKLGKPLLKAKSETLLNQAYSATPLHPISS